MKKIVTLFLFVIIIINVKITSFGAAQGEVIDQPFECYGAGKDEHYMTADEQFMQFSLIPYLNGKSDRLFLNRYIESKMLELQNPPFDKLDEMQNQILLSQYKKLALFGVKTVNIII